MDFKDLNLLDIGNTLHLKGALWGNEYGAAILFLLPDESITPPLMETPPVQVLEMTSDDWNELLRQSDIVETEILQKTKDGKVAKAILRKSARNVAKTWKSIPPVFGSIYIFHLLAYTLIV